jgi:hypothetical protein
LVVALSSSARHEAISLIDQLPFPCARSKESCECFRYLLGRHHSLGPEYLTTFFKAAEQEFEAKTLSVDERLAMANFFVDQLTTHSDFSYLSIVKFCAQYGDEANVRSEWRFCSVCSIQLAAILDIRLDHLFMSTTVMRAGTVNHS